MKVIKFSELSKKKRTKLYFELIVVVFFSCLAGLATIENINFGVAMILVYIIFDFYNKYGFSYRVVEK